MEDEEETTGYLIPDKVYDVLKWVGLIALPALGRVRADHRHRRRLDGHRPDRHHPDRHWAPSSAHSSAPARLKARHATQE